MSICVFWASWNKSYFLKKLRFCDLMCILICCYSEWSATAAVVLWRKVLVTDFKGADQLICIKVHKCEDEQAFAGSASRYSSHVIFVVLPSACVRGQCLQDCLSSLSELAENIRVFWTAWVPLTDTKNSKAPPSGVDHHPRASESRGNSQNALT